MTEPTEQTKHNWSDAWLLLAIIYANKNGPGSLDRIIAAGDLINHAIFKPEEFESGLYRLNAGGYITQKHQTFDITTKMIETSRRISLGSGYIQEELKEIERVLTTSPRQRPLPNNLKYAAFSMRDYRAALKKHVDSFGKRPESLEGRNT
jgi:hypothetical protein